MIIRYRITPSQKKRILRKYLTMTSSEIGDLIGVPKSLVDQKICQYTIKDIVQNCEWLRSEEAINYRNEIELKSSLYLTKCDPYYTEPEMLSGIPRYTYEDLSDSEKEIFDSI